MRETGTEKARRLTPLDVLLERVGEWQCGIEARDPRNVVPNGKDRREETRGCSYIPHPWVYFAEVESTEFRPGTNIMRKLLNQRVGLKDPEGGGSLRPPQGYS